MKRNVISSLPFHHSNLSASLHAMQQEGKYCDVVLHCGGNLYHAHRNVLAVQSEYLRELFQENGVPCNVELPPEATAIQVVLDFVYTGKAEFSQDETVNVMKTSHVLRLTTMYDCCKATLLENISWENYFFLWNLANFFDDEAFAECVVNFVAINFDQLVDEKDFLSLSLSQFRLLLSNEEIVVTSQDRVLESIVMWVKTDKNTRSAHLSSLLSYVQFEKLTKSYLQILVDHESIVWESPELMRHITKTVCTRYLHGDDSPTTSTSASIATNEETEPAIAIFGENEDKRIIFQFYSLDDDEWSPPEELSLRVSNMGILEHNGIIYLIGGKQNNAYVQTVFAYHIINCKLTEYPCVNEPRSHVGVGELAGNIYVIGGYNETGFLRTVERFDPVTEKWTYVAPLSEGRGGVGVAALNRKLYAVGGRAGTAMTPVATVESFDVGSGQWTQVTPMLFGRSHCGISVIQRRLYVVGGYTKDDPSSEGSVQCYNPINKMWHALRGPGIDDWITAGVAYNKFLYVMTDGGQILKFEPETETWTDRSVMPTISGYYVSAVLVQKPVWDT